MLLRVRHRIRGPVVRSKIRHLVPLTALSGRKAVGVLCLPVTGGGVDVGEQRLHVVA